MKPDSSLPCWREPTTGVCLEATEFRPHTHILFH
jgi:hypothetical protein